MSIRDWLKSRMDGHGVVQHNENDWRIHLEVRGFGSELSAKFWAMWHRNPLLAFATGVLLTQLAYLLRQLMYGEL